MTQPRLAEWGLVLAGVSLLLAPILWLPAAILADEPAAALVAGVVMSVGMPTVGATIVTQRPRHTAGWLMLVIGAATSIGMVADQLAGVDAAGLAGPSVTVWATWVGEITWPLTIPLLPLLVLLFPNGRPPHGWLRWLTVMLWTAVAIGVVTTALAPGPMGALAGSSAVANPLGLEALGSAARAVGVAALLFVVASVPLVIVASVARWLGGDEQQRRQLRGVLAVAVLGLLVISVGGVTGLGGVVTETLGLGLALLALPVAMGVAILHHRLWDLDPLVNRTLVWTTLSIVLLGVHLATVRLVSGVTAIGPETAQLVAAAAVALLFAQVRDGAQRLIDRWLFGDRGDADAAIDRLVARIGEVGDGDVVLRAVAEAVANALKVPFVAVRPRTTDGLDPVLVGAPVGGQHVTPLVHRGELVGELVVSERTPGERLSSADRRVLARLAPHAAAGVHALLLSRDLQHAQLRTVTAVEEERRRLRRDLHDGLGPTLGAVGLGLDRAVREVGTLTDEELAELLARLRDEVDVGVSAVRAAVDGLRPPALDDLGLLPSLRTRGAALADDAGIRISVTGPYELPDLPAAVETAAYRVVEEALTNVVRHAGATTCDVRLSADRSGALEVVVADDGHGLGSNWRPGVGLTSMRERALELGGSFELDSTPSGTTVSVVLPLGVGV